MLCEISIIRPTCHALNNGSVELIISGAIGEVFIDWTNIPKNVDIIDNGRKLDKVGRGKYNVVILDDISEKSFRIDVEAPDLLVLNDITTDIPTCINSIGEMNISWVGGTAPYELYLNGVAIVKTQKLSYSYNNIRPNIQYSILVKDINSCYAYKSDIIYPVSPILISLDIKQPECSECLASRVVANISGGSAPYKIGWFKSENMNTPLVHGVSEISGGLGAGSYSISVIDSNSCVKQERFTIISPEPISVSSKSRADYSHNMYYEPVEISRIYNLLLLEEDNCPNIELGDPVVIRCGKDKYNHITAIQTGLKTLKNKKYRYYYLDPGITWEHMQSIKNNDFVLVIGGTEYSLSTKMDYSSCMFMVGSLIMLNNYSFAFNVGDNIEIAYNKYNILSMVGNKHLVSGYYNNNNMVTIITFLEHESAEKVLKILGQYSLDKFFVVSKDTKSNNLLGNLCLRISGGQNRQYIIRCVGANYDKSFATNHGVSIDNLLAGTYQIIVSDVYNMAKYHNSQSISDPKKGFTIDILGSVTEEQDKFKMDTIATYHIDPELLNKYNSNKLERLPTLAEPDKGNSIIVNIAPTDADFKIVGDNYEIESSGYQTISKIKSGTYQIRVFKDGYVSQNHTFSVTKGQNNIVTAILSRANNKNELL